MNILPHILVLHQIRSSFEYLSTNTEHLNFILASYGLKSSMQATYNDFIDQSIQWIKKHANEVNFCLGYRLDAAKIPSISVTMEGGTESQQFMGDYGSFDVVDLEPIKYASFDIKKVNENGELVISPSYSLHTKVWRELRVLHGNKSWIIKDIQYIEGKDLVLVLDKPVKATESLKGWSAVSHGNNKIVTIGTSLDEVVVKIYMDIAGEPEMCEMLSLVIRYILKQSRFDLMSNGLNEIKFGYSAIMQNATYKQPAWTTVFTIRGKLTDQWILTENISPDSMSLTSIPVHTL
jgi:hypothetical protein